jgi:hypothetical protein
MEKVEIKISLTHELHILSLAFAENAIHSSSKIKTNN